MIFNLHCDSIPVFEPAVFDFFVALNFSYKVYKAIANFDLERDHAWIDGAWVIVRNKIIGIRICDLDSTLTRGQSNYGEDLVLFFGNVIYFWNDGVACNISYTSAIEAVYDPGIIRAWHL